MGLMQSAQIAAASFSLSMAALGQSGSGLREAAQPEVGAAAQVTNTPPRPVTNGVELAEKAINGFRVNVGIRPYDFSNPADRDAVISYIATSHRAAANTNMALGPNKAERQLTERAFDNPMVRGLLERNIVPYLDTAGEPLRADRSRSGGIEGCLSAEDSKLVLDAARARGVTAVAIQQIDFLSGKIGLIERTSQGIQMNVLEVSTEGLSLGGRPRDSFGDTTTLVQRMHAAVVGYYTGTLVAPAASATVATGQASPASTAAPASTPQVTRIIDTNAAPIENATFKLEGAQVALYENPRNSADVRPGAVGQFSLRNGSNRAQSYVVDMIIRDSAGNEQLAAQGMRINLDVKSRTRGPGESHIVDIRSTERGLNIVAGEKYTMVLRCRDGSGHQLLAESGQLTASQLLAVQGR